MSRQPSPGPSQPHPLPAQMLLLAASTPATRQKSKSYATGIAAGAEDEKYQAKYKELKRKVKEIELDNDKLQFKVLQSKRAIQRMKVERAVLYERLSVVPPSPTFHDRQALPPLHPGSRGSPHSHPAGIPGYHQHRDQQPDHDDHALLEYMRTHPNVRVVPGPDGRPVPVSGNPIGPGVAPSHSTSASHASKRASATGHDSSRQLPPLSQLTPVQHLEPPRIHGHSQSHSPRLNSHGNHSRSRSQSHSRGHQGPPQGYHPGQAQQYSPELLPPVQHVLQSPPIPVERERSRRHEMHDRGSMHGHGDSHSHGGRYQVPHAHPPTPSQLASPTITRSSARLHNHQRVGPGANINHHELDREREMERERDWERDRGREHELVRDREHSHSARPSSPQGGHRSRQPQERGEYREQAPPSYRETRDRAREEQSYQREPVAYTSASRSGTPGSGSGSGSGSGGNGAAEGPSRPDSRSQYYDRERQRPYAPRTVNQQQAPSEDLDFVHEDGRSHSRDSRDRGGGPFVPPEQHRPPIEVSRKRSRNDMEVDEEDDVDASPVGGSSGGGGGGNTKFPGGHLSDDRGGKRMHHDAHSATPSHVSDAQEEPEGEHSDA